MAGPKTEKKWIKSEADERAVANGCFYDEGAGIYVVDFFRELRHTKGKWAGKPFELLPWQAEDVIKPLFGWMNAKGFRRYRIAYIEIPKKNGKSAMCSGLALYLLAADEEPGAEVYCAAADRDQAGIVYREASAMAKSCKILKDYIHASDSIKNLALPSTNSFLRAISRESTTAEGLNIHGLIFDELHAQKTRDLWDTLRYGGASRDDPMIISITTAGYDRESICWEQHDYACKVRDGIIQDDTFFPYIRAAEEGDDWTDPEVWKKANPSWKETFSEEDFLQAFNEAKESSAKENSFKRYRLNIWTEQATRWLKMASWDKCAGEVLRKELRGKPCWLGLDLAATTDIAALVAVFPSEGNAVLPFFWVPEENATKREHRDRVPYLTWAREGLVELIPGKSIKVEYIRRRINEIAKEFSVQEIGYDPWNAGSLATQLEEEDGFTLVQVRQGYVTMNEPSKYLEKLILDEDIRHGGNPVLRWMASNVAVEIDTTMNIKPSKKHSYERIDGVVALIIALSRMMLRTEKRSVYARRGILRV
jgi:phage terminase large subunit-like protein